MGVEQKLGNLGIVTTSLEKAVNWARTRAMWPLLSGLACCAIEMMAAEAAHYDMSRFGMELMRASPRQSDLLIVAGGVFNNYAIVQGVDEVIPVDVYVGGCPPRPEGLIHGILALYEKVEAEELTKWK
jgi:NADH-quinone oxidoreductase subunit B